MGSDLPEPWADPFVSSVATIPSSDTLSLADVLALVGRANGTLIAGRHTGQAAEARAEQAGRRPNPELALEAEQLGWDAPGFSEAEVSIGISQDFDLWGARDAERRAAGREVELETLAVRQNAFDLYLETKARFLDVAYAQQGYGLRLHSEQLLADLVESIRIRVDKGATMSVELRLAELERARAETESRTAAADFRAMQFRLVSLWQEAGEKLPVLRINTERPSLPELTTLTTLLESSRDVVLWRADEAHLDAQAEAARLAARPTLNLGGGMKRNEADNNNTFMLSASLPLPFFNRNRGTVMALRRQQEAARAERLQALADARAELQAVHGHLTQLNENLARLDGVMLPAAEAAFGDLSDAYRAGRVPYTMLLESQRTLLDLERERNDLYLAMHRDIMALERLFGIPLIDNHNGER